MTTVRPLIAPNSSGLRKSATRGSLAVCIVVAAVCGSGYQGSLTGLTDTAGQLAAAAPHSAALSAAPTGWVGRELLSAPTPGMQDFLVPGQPTGDLASGGSAPVGNEVQVTSVPSDAPSRPGPGTLMSPLGTLSPSSPFGERINPLTGEVGEFHYGLDFAAPCGTSVHAADTGTVRAVGWHPWGGGNRVEIDHGNGLITTYNHLEGISVEAGDLVEVGQVVAAVGSTGSSTGCHLHFETLRDGSHVDPRGWTLTPLNPAAHVGTPDMTSYAPGGAASSTAVPWVIALPHEGSHSTADRSAGGTHGPALVAAPAVPTPAVGSTPPRPSNTIAPSPKPTRPPSAKPSDPGLPQPGPSRPGPSSPSPSPSPTKQSDPSPSPSSPEPDPENGTTPSPAPGPEPTPKPEPSPSPSPVPTPEPSTDPAPTPDPDPAVICEPETDPATGGESGEDPTPEHGSGPGTSPLPLPIPEPVINDEQVTSGASADPADGTTGDEAEDGAADGDPADPAPPCGEQEEPGDQEKPGANSDGEVADKDDHQDAVVAPADQATAAKP